MCSYLTYNSDSPQSLRVDCRFAINQDCQQSPNVYKNLTEVLVELNTTFTIYIWGNIIVIFKKKKTKTLSQTDSSLNQREWQILSSTGRATAESLQNSHLREISPGKVSFIISRGHRDIRVYAH